MEYIFTVYLPWKINLITNTQINIIRNEKSNQRDRSYFCLNGLL